MSDAKYDVYKWRGNECQPLAMRLGAEEAARLIDVDLNDLLASIDSEGRCDCERYVAVTHGDPQPGRK